MAETSKLENLLTALFGNDIDVKAEAQRIRDKRKQECDETLQKANEILTQHNIALDDIPTKTFRNVTLAAFFNCIRVFREDYRLMQQLKYQEPNEHIIENAKLFLAAHACYLKTCEMFREQTAFSEPEQRKINESIEWAKSILTKDQQTNLDMEIQMFAYMIFYEQVQTYRHKKEHIITDMIDVVAANAVKDMLLQPKPYDVAKAERQIIDLQRYAHYKKFPELPHELLMATIPTLARNNIELFDKAATEIDNLMNHTEETFGYRLNYIKSGKQEFSVFKWNGETDEGQEDEKYPKGTIWAEDKGEFPTLEEAQAVAEEGDEIEPYDPEEMWAIVDPNGNNPTNMIYPYKERAAVFLIGILGKNKLPNWYAWEELLENKEVS